MKKFLLLALSAAFVASASAEGYQVNTLSAKQLGMGHTAVSQKLGSESVWFNPAGAAFQKNKFSVSAGVTGIMATATYTPNNDYNPMTFERTSKSDNDWSTPMYLYANYKVTDNLALGLSFNTPFGSSMNWGDNWAGAHLVQNISLQAFSAQPTISYKMLDGKLSIGAGLMMSWGTFELSRSMFDIAYNSQIAGDLGKVAYAKAYAAAYAAAEAATPGSGAAAGAAAGASAMTATTSTVSSIVDPVGANPLASATLSGDAGLKFGYNIGVMYDFHKNWTLGVSYRSKIDMEVDAGVAKLDYANLKVAAVLKDVLPAINTGTFSASLPLPATLSAGLTYRPTDKWELATEIQWVQWNAYDVLSVKFNDPSLGGYSIDADKNYSNTIMARFGAEYEATEWITGRLGLYVDQSPVASDYLNPETPSMTKVGYTGGFSVMPCKNNRLFSIDFSYAYISSADPERAGSYPYENSLSAAVGGELQQPFAGNYTAKAHCVAFGATWGF